MPNNHNPCPAGERGVALISALALLVLLALLTASAVSLSLGSAASTASDTGRQYGFYRAESALNRAMLLLAYDRQTHASRQLGQPDAGIGAPTLPRYLADGVRHTWMTADDDAEPVTFAITDAMSGPDLSGSNPARQLPEGDPQDTVREQRRREFAERLNDYADADDFVRVGGMEAQHYRTLGIPRLPRNRPMQYREEVRWIPGATEFFPADGDGSLTSARLIAPPGLRPLSGRANLYALPPESAAHYGKLTPSETAVWQEALRLWQQERRPVTETLPPGILSKLTTRLSTQESGVYTITVWTDGCTLSGTLRFQTGNQPFEFYEYFVPK